MATNTSGGTTTSFSNTPQAVGDSFTSGLTEDSSGYFYFDVMANDLGGNAKTLWSLDDGTSASTATKIYAPADLLAQDTARAETTSTDTSANGARIWITADGKVGYDSSTLSSSFQAQLQSLAAGEFATDTFTYAIRLGNGTLAWTTVTLQIAGTNDIVGITSADATGAVVEDAASVATGSINFSDADLSDGHTATFAAAAGNTTTLGTFALAAVSEAANAADGSVQWTYTLDNAAAQYLAVGESATETFAVTIDDGQGSTVTQNVVVTIAGTNDAPVITAEVGDSAGQTMAETNAGLLASGTLTVTDIDTSDVVTASVLAADLTHTGPTGGLTDAQLLAFFSVTSGPIDTAATTSGQLAWDFNSGAQAFDFLAVGETLTLHYTIRPDDGHGPTFVGDGVVTIHVTGTNDVPVITTGAVSASVTENMVASVGGTMNATDPDNGAQEFWTVVGGAAPETANYLFVMDNFEIIKNGNTIFEDGFSDGNAPPSSPNFSNGNATTYGTNGSFTEAGGRLFLDSTNADTAVSVGTTDAFIGNFATVRSNINPADLVAGLKNDDNFTVEGLFDLIIPDDFREVYGIRLTDRLVGGGGTPPDQLGDDLIELVVRMGQDGVVRVQLRELDMVNDQTTNIGGVALVPPPGADQIMLRLTHSTTNVGALVPSFDYLSGGVVIGSTTLPVIGRIFGTETDSPGNTSGNENWTRAQIIAYAPALTDTTLAGTYGSLTISQAGAWTYALADNLTIVQNLAQGETAVETFTVQVADEHGAIDTETITVTVNGTNDGPNIVTGNVARTTSEDSETPTLTETGLAFFSDVDLTDTHTITHNYVGSTLSSGGPVPAGLPVALASALSATLIDAATGDSDGHYQWDFALANSAVQFLADGEVLAVTYAVQATDNHGANDSQTITINITGTNDGPVAVVDTNTGAALAEAGVAVGGNDAVAGNASAFGNVLANNSDVDTSDVLSVAGVEAGVASGHVSGNVGSSVAGTYGTLMLGVNGAWTYALDNANPSTDALAQGETVNDVFSYTAADGHGGLATTTLSIAVTGTNDQPVITSGPATGTVKEDISGQQQAVGNLQVLDLDHGAQDFWTVIGGSPTGVADYHFRIDSFTITKGGFVLLNDQFTDGNAPPSSSPFDPNNVGNGTTPTTYFTNGSFGEAGGRALLDSGNAVSFVGVGTTDALIGQIALARTNIDSTSTQALKESQPFTIAGVFDLVMPDSPREAYGIRATDRLIGGPGSPADRLGDDTYELVVRENINGLDVVQLRQLNFETNTLTNLQAFTINPPPGANQIRLVLDHVANDTVLHASFQYMTNGVATGPVQNFSAVAPIFGTAPGSVTDENWTRAAFVAYAPEFTDSLSAGSYGTLNVSQGGTWNYVLNNALASTQALAEGQHATDTFTVRVADEYGAFETTTITIDVTGSNDAPIMQTAAVSRSLGEDASPTTLTATGLAQFSDVDLTDTHTISASLQSATLSGGGAMPSGLSALLGNAMQAALAQPEVGDGHGQLQWDFALANSATQFLAQGQTLTVVYNVRATDPSGASGTQAVTINITGTNDGPVAVADNNAGDEDTIITGTVAGNDTDVDNGAVLTYTLVAPVAGLTLNADGSYSLDAGNAAYQSLAAGATLDVVAAYTVTDEHGAASSSSLTVTLTGTADGGGDGNLDIVLQSYYYAYGGLTVSENNGDGTFTSGPTLPATGGTYHFGIALGDVNGDGTSDIVTGDYYNGANVRLNNGDGTFAAPSTVYTGSYYNYDVALGDVNCDGDLDIVTTSYYPISYGTGVSLGNGDGTFATGPTVYTTSGSNTYTYDVALGDVNNDGKLDIVTSDVYYGADVSLGNGNGTFAAGTTVFTGGSYHHAVALGDVNNDGKLDIVTSDDYNGANVSLGNGNGTFAASTTVYTGGNNHYDVALGDVNNDGKLDIVTGDYYNGANVSLGNGNGTFAAATTVFTGGNYHLNVELGDLNGDGNLDIIVSSSNNNGVNGANVSLGNGNGTFAAGTPVATGFGYYDLNALALGDVV